MNKLICYTPRGTLNRSSLSSLLTDEYREDHFVALEVHTTAIPNDSNESNSNQKYYLSEINSYGLILLRYNDSVVCNESLEVMPSEDSSIFLGINSIILIKNLYSAIRQQDTHRKHNRSLDLQSAGIGDFLSVLNLLPESSKRLYAAIIAIIRSKAQTNHLNNIQCTLDELNRYSEVSNELEEILKCLSSIHRVSSDSYFPLIEKSKVSHSKRNESILLSVSIPESISGLISSNEHSNKMYETISAYFKTTC